MVVSQLSDDEDDDFGSTSYTLMNLFHGMLYICSHVGWVSVESVDPSGGSKESMPNGLH